MGGMEQGAQRVARQATEAPSWKAMGASRSAWLAWI